SSIRDRSVWVSPGSHPTLYFHGDSPIPLGEFERGYLVPGGHWYIENKNFYQFPPGAHYRYSNIAAALSGSVVESVGGIRFWQHCNREIFQPRAWTRPAGTSGTSPRGTSRCPTIGNWVPLTSRRTTSTRTAGSRWVTTAGTSAWRRRCSSTPRTTSAPSCS